LNADAGKTLSRLASEAQELHTASEGHDKAVEAASDEAHDAARVLQDRENALSQLTEDVARLAARHQSAERLLQDAETTLNRSEEAEKKANDEAQAAGSDLKTAEAAFGIAETALTTATEAAATAEAALTSADDLRGKQRQQLGLGIFAGLCLGTRFAERRDPVVGCSIRATCPDPAFGADRAG